MGLWLHCLGVRQAHCGARAGPGEAGMEGNLT